MKTIRKAGKSIKMISLKASEIYQGRGDLKGQSPEKRERKHKE